MEVYVARQPIFDKKKKVYGYELLFREGTENVFSGIDGNVATSKVLSNSFFTIGIEKIISKRKAFINFTRDHLVHNIPQLFSKEKMTIEILEDVEPDKIVIETCKRLSQEGYEIALDDFLFRPEMTPLIEIANIIKIDFRSTPIERIKNIINQISNRSASMLAEKIETNEEFEVASDLGFDFFQGYFFSKPEILKGKDITSTQMNYLEIMAEINKRDFEFSKVERIVERDVAISYKLMRYINSAFYRRINEISSIKQAIVLLGEQGIRSFLSLVALTNLASDKPDELIRSSIIRAKFCELVGKKENGNNSRFDPSELFTLGLFSAIDAILNDSMENLMEKLPLSETLKKALIKREGDMHDYLNLAICYEKGRWVEVTELESSLNLADEKLPECFMDALKWADTITSIQ